MFSGNCQNCILVSLVLFVLWSKGDPYSGSGIFALRVRPCCGFNLFISPGSLSFLCSCNSTSMYSTSSASTKVCHTCTCRYLNINQLKNLFQIKIILISCPTHFAVSCRPNTLLMWAWSCVEFVLPKMLPRINIVFELLQDRKGKVTQYGLYEKGIFWVAFRSALLVGSLLISWKIPFKWIWYCVLSDVFYGELLFKYDINVARSCVDSVLLKMRPNPR